MREFIHIYNVYRADGSLAKTHERASEAARHALTLGGGLDIVSVHLRTGQTHITKVR